MFFKSPRSLTINRNSNFELNQQRVSVEDTSDEFSIKKPVVQDKPYSDFLSFLYRNDKAKSKVKREIKTSGILNSDTVREKRMIVFRWVSVIGDRWMRVSTDTWFLDLCLSTSNRRSNGRECKISERKSSPKNQRSHLNKDNLRSLQLQMERKLGDYKFKWCCCFYRRFQHENTNSSKCQYRNF